MWRLYSLQYKGAMPGMEETSHQAPLVRNTGRQKRLSQPIYVEDPRGVKGKGRDQTTRFPFPPNLGFTAAGKIKPELCKIAESGYCCGASERLSTRLKTEDKAL